MELELAKPLSYPYSKRCLSRDTAKQLSPNYRPRSQTKPNHGVVCCPIASRSGGSGWEGGEQGKADRGLMTQHRGLANTPYLRAAMPRRDSVEGDFTIPFVISVVQSSYGRWFLGSYEISLLLVTYLIH